MLQTLRSVIKKADIILFCVLVLIGLGLSWYAAYGSSEGTQVVVTVDGKLYGTYPLTENRTITIQEKNHTNKFTIKDGKVQMSASNCKNQVCVKSGEISTTKQSIVCLPHRIVIEIQGGGGDYDAISQ